MSSPDYPSATAKKMPERQEEVMDQDNGARKRKKSDISESSEQHDQNDPEAKQKEKDAKNWKRIMANRKSARESRLRRIKYMETLEKSVEELTKENTALLRENQMMANENFRLRRQLASLGAPTNEPPSASMADDGLPPVGAAAGRSLGATSAGSGQGFLGGTEGSVGGMGLPSGGPSRPSFVASRGGGLGASSLDMHPGLSSLNPMLAPVQDEQQLALDMIRRRMAVAQAQAPHPPSIEEEQQLIEMMRRRRGQL